MQQQIERVCTACGTHFMLGRGETRTCPGPGCGRAQVASEEPKATGRAASSLRASDRKGYRLLGRHGGQRRGRRRETPFAVRGQQPDPQALAAKRAYHQALAEKRAYWKAEYAAIEEDFGPALAEQLRQKTEPK